MDAAKAHQHGQVLGLGCYCHAFFFSLPLSQHTHHANSIATLELMALVAAVATIHAFFRHFPRVVLESVSFSATFHLADDKAKDDAAKRALEYLHAIPAFLSSKPQIHVRHPWPLSGTPRPLSTTRCAPQTPRRAAQCRRLPRLSRARARGLELSTCSRSPVTSRCIRGPPVAWLRSRMPARGPLICPVSAAPSCALLRLLPCCRE
eukprot:2702645-Pleurochrysis_carterae.AAC.2